MIDKILLKESAIGLGVELNEKMLSDFDIFAEMLVETNKLYNLTAITQPDEIVTKHFADSLTLLNVGINENSNLIDVGTGAGFPAIPLMIARPDLHLTMIDGSAKKLKFVDEVRKILSLNGETIHIRAEELGKDLNYREKFDYATARAVSSMQVLSEFCLPFVSVGGSFYAMKGLKADEELRDSETAINLLGGKIERKINIMLDESASRTVVCIKKVHQTPTKYPRTSAQIAKKAL